MSRRPEFLTRPGAWVRTGSRVVDPALDACAIEGPRPTSRMEAAAGVLLAVVLGIVGAALVVHWCASS